MQNTAAISQRSRPSRYKSAIQIQICNDFEVCGLSSHHGLTEEAAVCYTLREAAPVWGQFALAVHVAGKSGLGLLLTSVGTRSQAPFSHGCPDVPPPVVLWIPPDGRQSSHWPSETPDQWFYVKTSPQVLHLLAPPTVSWALQPSTWPFFPWPLLLQLCRAIP